MAHGDLYETGFGYNLYSKLLRNQTTLTLLRFFQKQIIDYQINRLKTKKICSKFIEYQNRFEKISKQYPLDSLIIEGHFHQGVKYKNYISLPSLACQGKIGLVINGKILFKSP
jgi:UDP-2,3-diacylglucosamine pyrophosphatase LpxH